MRPGFTGGHVTVRAWEQIADGIAAKIADGSYPPGSRLPPEAVLAAEYGHARLTVRRAMAELRVRGLIITVHGLGSYVLPPAGEEPPRPLGGVVTFRARGLRSR